MTLVWMVRVLTGQLLLLGLGTSTTVNDPLAEIDVNTPGGDEKTAEWQRTAFQFD
jgi:hypothetical protein